MKTRLHNVLAVCLVLLLVGCSPWIKGFVNSALHKPLPSSGTFKVEYLGENEVEATKIDRILVYQFKKLGYNILVFFNTRNYSWFDLGLLRIRMGGILVLGSS